MLMIWKVFEDHFGRRNSTIGTSKEGTTEMTSRWIAEVAKQSSV
jgi:hypothetical protein